MKRFIKIQIKFLIRVLGKFLLSTWICQEKNFKILRFSPVFLYFLNIKKALKKKKSTQLKKEKI